MSSRTEPGRPRVVLVVPTFPKRSETFIARQFLGLLARGVDAHVLCRSSPDDAWTAALRPHRARVHVDRLGGGRRVLLSAPTRIARVVCRRPRAAGRYLARAARRHGPLGGLRRLILDAELLLLDPSIVHFEFGTLAIGREDVGQLLGCRVVVSFRGFDLNFVGLETPGFYDRIWSHADVVHVLGADLHRRAVRRGLPPTVPCVEVPPAVDASRFRPPAAPDDDPVSTDRPLEILSVARLTWKKGFEHALRAVRRLLDRGVDARYRIVGDGELLPCLAFLRHELGLVEHVELLGARDADEIAGLLASADVFLHLAVSEGFCNAVLEAQAAGVPVVASDADGLAENVADGETGLIVPRRDPEAAAEALATLAGDATLRRRMGEAGRRRAATFSPAREIDGFLAIYERALA